MEQRAISEFIDASMREHREVLERAARELPEPLEQLISAIDGCLHAGGKVLVCGNGGSAADAQHLAAELVCRVRTDRRALAAVALTTDTSALTAIANDYGYDRVFARQIEALAEEGDVLVAISTSGNSPNVLEAARAASSRGLQVAAMTGADGGALRSLADLVIAAPSTVVSRIQEMHSLCLHVVAESVERMAAAEGNR